jgi:predicted acylesterase/phospholipase RssA
MKDTLIVISGGGFCQIENALGCLKALEESGMVELHSAVNTVYSCASAGAICAGLMMKPMFPQAAIELIRTRPADSLITRKWFWFLRMWLKNGWIYDRTGLEKMLRSVYGDDEYCSCSTIVTKLNGMSRECMTGTYQSILASSSILGIFPPARIGNTLYIDGGYTDNVPLRDWQLPDYRHTYIILYPDDPDRARHQKTTVGKLLASFDTKLGQQVDEAEDNYGDEKHYPTVTVLRPPPTATSLLSWSDNYKLVDYAYSYATTVLQQKGLWKT